jgi:glucose-1-phosphatase
LQNIKHIIFDLGNVILNIDYNAPVLAFKGLGINNFEEIFSQAVQNKLSDDIETGAIAEDIFIDTLKHYCTPSTSTRQVVDAWNSIIENFPLRRLQLLKQLQLHYDLFLLSNTNIIHERYYNKVLFDTCGEPSLSGFFDKVYLSHRIGLRKPDPRAWQLILTENNLNPEHTLFLDDSIQHINAATKLGINCIHVTKENSMEDIFKAKS